MGMSRANWESESSEKPKEQAKEKPKPKSTDSIPGDKGSTVDQIRTQERKTKEAIDKE